MIGPVENKRAFQAFRSAGVRVRSGSIQMIFTPTDGTTSTIQLAFAINRKFGNAVQRNRARRRMRESFRQSCCSLPNPPLGGAFLLLADPEVKNVRFDDLTMEMNACFSRLQSKGAF